ncbi:hypothetical protein, partial [Streptomyces anulatus]|uniref:hypothetical protein n=1 Tax=Streptomyces anulatus TaxID=1892 RepID=UPI0034493416
QDRRAVRADGRRHVRRNLTGQRRQIRTHPMPFAEPTRDSPGDVISTSRHRESSPRDPAPARRTGDRSVRRRPRGLR